ncbi:hypothetical protein BKA57DRAFT_475586 [Linnemannia elongata]|nr:hypothetical protein BKA57DRAFT_475586 [Linnemannia elongata]
MKNKCFVLTFFVCSCPLSASCSSFSGCFFLLQTAPTHGNLTTFACLLTELDHLLVAIVVYPHPTHCQRTTILLPPPTHGAMAQLLSCLGLFVANTPSYDETKKSPQLSMHACIGKDIKSL